jgi:hypothetical protein
LHGQARADQFAPDPDDQRGRGARAWRAEQFAQEERLAPGPQAEAAVVARRRLRRLDDARQTRALVDQPQQFGVDGVDPRADLIQRRRLS